MDYSIFKQRAPLYQRFQMAHNPFDISPLFKNFHDKEICEKEEKLFVLTPNLFQEVHILKEIHNRRVLVYGLYGNGKTTFVDFILHLAYHYHDRFCTRMIITQDNVRRSINELLTSLCFDIIAEICKKSWKHPVASILKWLAERQFHDFLIENIRKLIGSYTEINEVSQAKHTKKSASFSLGVVQGGIDFDQVTTMRKSIQSYVETLPLRQVGEYLAEFSRILEFIGYRETVIFLDEADHLPKIDEFLAMLTRAREILFSSGYSFFVAGSPEIAKYTESLGAIFDKLIFVEPANWEEFLKTLQVRICLQNSGLSVTKLFEIEALEFIFQSSRGVYKDFLRFAENAFDAAVISSASKVNLLHCQTSNSFRRNEITHSLKDAHIKILQYLASFGSTTPSNKEMQLFLQLKRTYLRTLLEELLKGGYVFKEKRGRVSYYSISSQYQSYFLNDQ